MLRSDAVHPGISIYTNSIEVHAAIIRLLDYYSNLIVMATDSIETSVALYSYQTTRCHAHKVTAKRTSRLKCATLPSYLGMNSFGLLGNKVLEITPEERRTKCKMEIITY
jgi:hypothetical protein